jgi:hypothetical protein
MNFRYPKTRSHQSYSDLPFRVKDSAESTIKCLRNICNEIIRKY